WIFSGAVHHVAPPPQSGETVLVRAKNHRALALGSYSPHSQIRVRIWTFDPGEAVGNDFFEQRITAALALRVRLPDLNPCTARRLINAESDGLPGLIVDQYNDFLAAQFLSAGAEYWKSSIVNLLKALVPCRGIVERSDADVRAKEGLPVSSGLLWGEPPPEHLAISLGGLKVLVDIMHGHKTGFYLDQRLNQARAAQVAAGADVLNCFSYSGVFGLWALKAGAARLTQIDASQTALDLAKANIELNQLTEVRTDLLCGNAFELLRKMRDSRRQFDLIVLDPPKFVASASQMKKGCRAYKDINLLAFKLLKPGGTLFTFSCSGLIAGQLFQKIVADAALDAGRQVTILEQLIQAPDHRIALNFPESLYLKGLACRVAP
ncbi:MAG: class I SAM-dependent methyltransferase, partial [Desulfosarcinaceae bacterium]